MNSTTINWSQRIKALIYFIIFNAMLSWLAWEGINGNEGAGRLLSFIAWVFGLLKINTGIVRAKFINTSEKRILPAQLTHGFGIILISFLVWHGWWFTAIALMLSQIGQALVYLPKDEPKDENKS